MATCEVWYLFLVVAKLIDYWASKESVRLLLFKNPQQKTRECLVGAVGLYPLIHPYDVQVH